jgi:hypothetical protein
MASSAATLGARSLSKASFGLGSRMEAAPSALQMAFCNHRCFQGKASLAHLQASSFVSGTESLRQQPRKVVGSARRVHSRTAGIVAEAAGG